MSFKPLKEIPIGGHDVERSLIANSATITVGDLLIPDTTNPAAVLGAANTTGSVLGVCLGIVGKNGKVLEVNSWTASASNETVAGVQAYWVPATLRIKWIADLTAAAGTTTNSSKMGSMNVDSASSSKLLESSYIVNGGSSHPKQFTTLGSTAALGIPPYSTTKVVGYFSSTRSL